MLGSEASEPGDSPTDQKTQILPTSGVFGALLGVIPFQHQQNIAIRKLE